jgi:L-ribulose-5-phosphate 4-epimerase
MRRLVCANSVSFGNPVENGETMLLKSLREEVLEANLELVRRGLVLYTFGNASGVDREQGLVVIKPSGVDYDELKPEHMVVTDLNGRIVDGSLRPSSDLDTHTLLYREFEQIGAIMHTHSEFATSFAQAGMPIPAFGTTHADYFYGPVPVTAPLSDDAIGGLYVHETGLAIVSRFKGQDGSPPIDPLAVPACLVAGHAPFAWGETAHEAAHNAVVLEAVARMAYRTLSLKANADEVSQALLDRHYFRKHGQKATYGQHSPGRISRTDLGHLEGLPPEAGGDSES